jgi:hypothetical protein
MAVVFLVGGLFHLLKFNRRVIWAYVRRSREEKSQFRWAIVASTVIFGMVLAGTLVDTQPFSAVMDLNDLFREGLLAKDTALPPTPHFEELTLAEVAGGLGVEPAAACERLRRQGLECDDADERLLELARANRRSPDQIYRLIVPNGFDGRSRPDRHISNGTGRGEGRGDGWGRMTVAEAADRLGVSLEAALQNLRRNGIEATGDESLRAVSERAGVRPADVFPLMSPGAR